MNYEFLDPKLNAFFGISDFIQKEESRFSTQKGVNKLFWNRSENPIHIEIDGIEIPLAPQQILTTTAFHQIHYSNSKEALTAMLFNKGFYCLADHDSEVGCNGILFYGTQDLPLVNILAYQPKFDLLWEVILEEFRTHDNIQGEMLQMLLKRFIILCTRLAKEQLTLKKINDSQIEGIRQFNYLVDIHFKEKRKVKDYAELLHKSPKTLSNLFALYNQKSPQQIIQERVVLEAKRLLHFTEKQTQEIAYDLGFEDSSYFSRYFKKVAKVTPSQYKEQYHFGQKK